MRLQLDVDALQLVEIIGPRREQVLDTVRRSLHPLGLIIKG